MTAWIILTQSDLVQTNESTIISLLPIKPYPFISPLTSLSGCLFAEQPDTPTCLPPDRFPFRSPKNKGGESVSTSTTKTNKALLCFFCSNSLSPKTICKINRSTRWFDWFFISLDLCISPISLWNKVLYLQQHRIKSILCQCLDVKYIQKILLVKKSMYHLFIIVQHYT